VIITSGAAFKEHRLHHCSGLRDSVCLLHLFLRTFEDFGVVIASDEETCWSFGNDRVNLVSCSFNGVVLDASGRQFHFAVG
jgi:hypothetical protein